MKRNRNEPFSSAWMQEQLWAFRAERERAAAAFCEDWHKQRAQPPRRAAEASMTISIHPSDRPLLAEMLETGYRRLVSAHHPDRNPTGAAKTVQLNRLIETLRSQLRESPQRVNGH
jgi:hypothetical protein